MHPLPPLRENLYGVETCFGAQETNWHQPKVRMYTASNTFPYAATAT
jgi:hypothetical protein